jgi:hypothetical protein
MRPAARITTALTLVGVLLSGAQAIQQVTRAGRYLYTADGTRFYIKGVAYQEQGVCPAYLSIERALKKNFSLQVRSLLTRATLFSNPPPTSILCRMARLVSVTCPIFNSLVSTLFVHTAWTRPKTTIHACSYSAALEFTPCKYPLLTISGTPLTVPPVLIFLCL